MTYDEIRKHKHTAILLNQNNGFAELYDLDKPALDAESLLASYDTGYATGLKVRYSRAFGGYSLFVSTEGAAVFSLESCRKLWEAPAYGDNAHSIEWIEQYGILCIACSTGASVLFYRPDCPAEPFATLPLPDAHGVLWDEARQLLWAAGLDKLVQIQMAEQGPLLLKEYRMPQGYGAAHDLSAVYGAPDRLWVTCNQGKRVLQFDKTKETFLVDYPGSDIIPCGVYHKGIGNDQDGSMAWLYPDGRLHDSKYHKNASWLTDRISFYNGIHLRVLVSRTGLFYKLRICNSDYQ